MFQIKFHSDYKKYWKKIPKEEHYRINKKLEELFEEKKFRHLKFGAPYFVLEIGQYRICFIEEEKTRILLFVGNHKEYDKWTKTIN